MQNPDSDQVQQGLETQASDPEALISASALLSMYAWLTKAGMLRERCGSPAGQGSPNHALLLGREAPQIGAVAALSPEDLLMPSPAHYLACAMKGMHLADIFSGVRTGEWPKRSFSGNIMPPPEHAAERCTVSIGAALARGVQHPSTVVLVFVGKLSKGEDCSSAIRYAVEHKVPVIFVVEDQRAVAGVERDVKSSTVFGAPSMNVDADDVLAIHRVAQEAVDRARRGYGPTIVECLRLTSKSDPCSVLRSQIAKHGLWTAEWEEQLKAEFAAELSAAVRPSPHHRSARAAKRRK